MKNINKIFVLLFISFSVSLFAQETVVIVNNSVKESTLSKNDIKKIYLGKTDAWEDGSNVHLAYLDPISTELGSKFFSDVVDVTFQKFSKIWIKKVFSGYGSKPAKFSEEKAIINFVSQNKGAIGFIKASSVTDAVKVAATIK